MEQTNIEGTKQNKTESNQRRLFPVHYRTSEAGRKPDLDLRAAESLDS